MLRQHVHRGAVMRRQIIDLDQPCVAFRRRMSEEQTVSLVDVLEEDEELEEEASAVLAGSDPDHCSYPQVGAPAVRPPSGH